MTTTFAHREHPDYSTEGPMSPNEAAIFILQQRLHDLDHEIAMHEAQTIGDSKAAARRWQAKQADLAKRRQGLQARLGRCQAWAAEQAAQEGAPELCPECGGTGYTARGTEEEEPF